MKVLLINGSPHQYGCTYTALKEVADSLNRNDVATEIYHIGAAPIRGCVGCGSCFATGKCVFDNDGVNEISRRLVEFDGIVVGSPVYYAGASRTALLFPGQTVLQQLSQWKDGREDRRSSCLLQKGRRQHGF